MNSGLVVTLPYPWVPTELSTAQGRKQTLEAPKPPFPGRMESQSHRDGAHIVGPTGEGNKQLDRLCPPSCGLPGSDF